MGLGGRDLEGVAIDVGGGAGLVLTLEERSLGQEAGQKVGIDRQAVVDG
jgi:hypothetical protein